MVELLTDYTTKIYHALSTDTRPTVDPGAQLWEIDTGKRFIFDGGSWHELPDGGTIPTLITKTITENGTYAASDDNADGYSSVTVDVAASGTQVDNWLCVAGEFTTVSASPTFSVSTGISNATLVAFLCKMITPVEDAPAPSTYDKTYCYASNSYINRAVMWNLAQIVIAGLGIYKEDHQFTYWNYQSVNLNSNGIITIANGHSDTTIVPAGVSYKWMAILEV